GQIVAAIIGRAAQAGHEFVGRLVGGDGSHHHAAHTQLPGQDAGVYALDADNVTLLEKGVEALCGPPVARRLFTLAHDESLDLHAPRLEVFGVDAVVADEGIGECDN